MNVTIGRNQSIIGTYDHSEIEGLMAKELIRPDDLYWHDGMTEWKPVASNWKSAVSAVLDDEEPSPEEIAYSRKMGVIAILAAAALIWLCIINPIRDAQNGAESISTSIKGVLLIPFGCFFGPIYLFLPKLAIRLIGLPQQKKKMMYVVSIILGLIGFLLYRLVIHKLETLGYS